VEALFERALERPAGRRAQWVRDEAGDEAVASEVLALLAAHDRQGVLDAGSAARAVGLATEDLIGRLAAALGERYRVERVLGEGGMASVFLARELKHDRAVALKVLRPEVAAWVGADRFLAEIRIVARLSHPHILALIDSGEADRLLYYAMPFLGGETLRARIAQGPLPIGEIVILLRDVASALAHAHGHGVVHRDLKPENVLWTGGHAFLMDFGVAKLRAEADATTRTAEGLAIGTPAYMAPEQAAGDPVDQRADLYSWALLAREALLGRLERQADLGAERPDAPPELRRLIEECGADDPASRPADGAEVLRRLDAIPPREGRGAGGTRPRAGPLWRRWLAGLGLVLVGLGVAGAATLLLSRRSPPNLASLPGPVVVGALRNETGDTALAAWGRLAGAWLTQGLQQTGRARVVPWPVALQASERIAAGEARGGSPVDLLRQETGAGAVVTGAYYLVGPDLRFQVELIDARNGTTLGVIPAVAVPRDSASSGIQLLRDRLMGALAIRTDDRLAGALGMVDRPPTFEAYRRFDRGISLYNQLDYRPAAEALVEAWRADTTFLPALVYAARAMMNTGEPARVDSLVRSLRRRQPQLTSHLDLEVQYLEAVLANDARRALAAIRRAAAEAPGSRAGYNVAVTALAVNQPEEALAELRKLDPDRGGMRGWAPYWYSLSHALHLLSRHDEELAAARELRRRHPESRAAWVHEARALGALGRLTELDSLVRDASPLAPDTYWSLGAMLVTAGEELLAHHGSPDAARFFSQAETWLANQLAREPRHRAHRYWLGSVYYDRRQWDDAETYFESLARDHPDDDTFRGLWALTAAHRGDTALAARRIGPEPRYGRGSHTAARARIAAVGGNVEAAVALWSQALSQGVSGLVWLHGSARADLLPLRDDPRFARLALLGPAPTATDSSP
jgi:serine/threonine-protein kinase